MTNPIAVILSIALGVTASYVTVSIVDWSQNRRRPKKVSEDQEKIMDAIYDIKEEFSNVVSKVDTFAESENTSRSLITYTLELSDELEDTVSCDIAVHLQGNDPALMFDVAKDWMVEYIIGYLPDFRELLDADDLIVICKGVHNLADRLTEAAAGPIDDLENLESLRFRILCELKDIVNMAVKTKYPLQKKIHVWFAI